MILLADESVDAQIVERLREDGLQVISVAEISPSVSDSEVLEQANQDEALLVTADKDFGELVYQQGRIHNGVILLRLAGLTATEKANIVSEVIGKHGNELPGAFAVISPGMVRLRRGF